MSFQIKWSCVFQNLGIEVPQADLQPPQQAIQLLDGPCPIWRGEKMCQTHVLVPLPKEMGTLMAVMQKLKRYAPTEYFTLHISASKAEKMVFDKTRWVLLTNRSLPKSEGKPYAKQVKMVEDLRRNNLPYEVPSVKDGYMALILHYLATGIKLHCGVEKMIYTKDTEKREVTRWCCVRKEEDSPFIISFGGKAFSFTNIDDAPRFAKSSSIALIRDVEIEEEN